MATLRHQRASRVSRVSPDKRGGKNLSRTEVEGVPRSSGCYEMLFNLSRALALVTRRQSRKVNETQWNRSCLIEITSCNYYVL